MFYLALVVRLVSDPAPECRSAASSAVGTLLNHVSPAIFQELLDFTGQWFGEAAAASSSAAAGVNGGGGDTAGSDPGLRRTAAQASGIFVQARPELVRKGAGGKGRLPWLLSALSSMLPRRAADVIAAARSAGWGDAGGGAVVLAGGDGGGAEDDWEGVYHAVLSIGKAFEALPGAFNAALSDRGGKRQGEGDEREEKDHDAEGGAFSSNDLFERLLEALLYPHAWVRLAAARVWGSLFAKRDPGTLAASGGGGRPKEGGPTAGRRQGGAATPGRAKGKGGDQQGDDAEEGRGDGGQEFLRKRRVLFRLCQNFCSQLNRSQVIMIKLFFTGSICCSCDCNVSLLKARGATFALLVSRRK